MTEQKRNSDLFTLRRKGSSPKSKMVQPAGRVKVALNTSIAESSVTLPDPMIKLGDLNDSQHDSWDMDVHSKANRLSPISDMTRDSPGSSDCVDPEVLDVHLSSLSNLMHHYYCCNIECTAPLRRELCLWGRYCACGAEIVR